MDEKKTREPESGTKAGRNKRPLPPFTKRSLCTPSSHWDRPDQVLTCLRGWTVPVELQL